MYITHSKTKECIIPIGIKLVEKQKRNGKCNKFSSESCIYGGCSSNKNKLSLVQKTANSRPGRESRFSKQKMESLLETVGMYKPLDREEWHRVAREHCARYLYAQRTILFGENLHHYTEKESPPGDKMIPSK